MFKLRFSEKSFRALAARYPAEVDEEIEALAARAQARGHLNREEFLALCFWKTPRSRKQCRRNRESLIEETTRVALATRSEELKVGTLLLLSGVAWPTASVILHLCDRAPYPILDVRALWSVGLRRTPRYDFDFWWAYVQFTRDLARRTRCSMRAVDRALWQYSKERQRVD